MGNRRSETNEIEKIGRLKMTIAKSIGRKCADIYISRRSLKHIEEKHKKEFNQLGIDAFGFVKIVVDGFNQIREGSGSSILLVIFNESLHNTAGIDMSLDGNIWLVKTAEPRSSKDIEKRKLLWKK